MKRLGVLTSGGDAPGMNSAVRAVVRSALDRRAAVFAIYEGYRGMVDGGKNIRPMGWGDVGGILHKGGTIIGTARCKEFMDRSGRLKAARNLLVHGIDSLVVIGGDGSLTGAVIFQEEWSGLLAELVESGQINAETAAAHPSLAIAGLVASIDNDVCNTDITIGADTALHRIVAAVDAITDTAASHQRAFVIEVMGRKCGYLTLMAGLATAADWVLIPESPPNLDAWEEKMCAVLSDGRKIGRRDSIVIVAEGAQDRHGSPISSNHVRQVIEQQLHEDVRVTILGHVQRGGSPSAFDRNLGTLQGVKAVDAILADTDNTLSTLIALQSNNIVCTDLRAALEKTWAVRRAVEEQDFQAAMELRGPGYIEAFQTLRTLIRALPRPVPQGRRQLRIGLLNAGAPSPGMNTAVRAAVRLGVDRGHTMIGFHNGIRGLIEGDAMELDWMAVNGWAPVGGAYLGTTRVDLKGRDYYAIARSIDEYSLDALLIIGGWSGYEAALNLHQQRQNFQAFDIPIACIPATIDNDLPGAELCIGADTALNSIVDAVDKIKQSAVATRRVFVVEVMGNNCGYLALMSALAAGAERVYLPEEGIDLNDLRADIDLLVTGFRQGKKLGVVLRSELANRTYSTPLISALFEEEGGDAFDVRHSILGHIQQGGNPTPFDRIQATRFAAKSIAFIEEQAGSSEPRSACVGMVNGRYRFTYLEELPRQIDRQNQRPKEQWWLSLRPIARMLAQPSPDYLAADG